MNAKSWCPVEDGRWRTADQSNLSN